MTSIIFFLCATAGLAFSLFQTKILENQFKTAQNHIEKLQGLVNQKRHHLRKKLNRNLILQKQMAGEATPVVTFNKIDKTAQALLPSDTIYSLAEDSGFGLSGTCEGNGDCGLCAITVISGSDNLSPINEVEQEILNKFNYSDSVRLCCQTRIHGDVTVDFLEPGS